jgi:hypothetical protein
MAQNTINWGKIYETSYWGNGIEDNTISWGRIYADEAGYSTLTDRYALRVQTDGGVVEAESCVSNALLPNGNWDYYFRVFDDGGVVEAFTCLN